jgi:uncharacterized protein (TIGR02391 family)
MAQRFGRPLGELLDLDVDEVAILLIDYLRREGGNGRRPHLGNALNDARIEAHESGFADQEVAIRIHVAAAWQWLRNHLLVVPDDGFWETLSPLADRVGVPDYLVETRAKDLFRGMELDAELEVQAMPSFRRGAYAVAVLAAFRLVESRVRELAGLERKWIGEDLMFKAFNPDGPLADPELLAGENVGRAHLFAGAMLAIKNEHSHRTVNLDDPREAAELVLFANSLLRIAARAKATATR